MRMTLAAWGEGIRLFGTGSVVAVVPVSFQLISCRTGSNWLEVCGFSAKQRKSSSQCSCRLADKDVCAGDELTRCTLLSRDLQPRLHLGTAYIQHVHTGVVLRAVDLKTRPAHLRPFEQPWTAPELPRRPFISQRLVGMF